MLKGIKIKVYTNSPWMVFILEKNIIEIIIELEKLDIMSQINVCTRNTKVLYIYIYMLIMQT